MQQNTCVTHCASVRKAVKSIHNAMRKQYDKNVCFYVMYAFDYVCQINEWKNEKKERTLTKKEEEEVEKKQPRALQKYEIWKIITFHRTNDCCHADFFLLIFF